MAYDQNGNSTGQSTDSQIGGAISGLAPLASQAGGMGGGIGSDALSGAGAGFTIGGPWGAAIGGIVGAGWGLYSGLHQKAEAKKLLKQNPYPTQPIPESIQQNASAANRLALQGLPSAQYQAAMNNIQRQQQNAIQASQDRRSGMGAIGQTNQTAQDTQLNLSAQDQAARRQNIMNAQQQNQVLGQYQNQAWQWNNQQKYLQNYQYAMSLLGSGNQNITRGIDAAASGLTRLPNGAYKSMWNGIFGGRGNQQQVDTTAVPSYQISNGSDLPTQGYSSF